MEDLIKIKNHFAQVLNILLISTISNTIKIYNSYKIKISFTKVFKVVC